MAIILEGCDGSGKTSLARQLQDYEPRLRYFHSGSAPTSDEHENLCLAEQQAKAMESGLIIDRVTAISQQVYAGREFEAKLVKALENLCQGNDVVIVYCRPPNDHLLSPEKLNWRDTESDEYKEHIIRMQHVFIQRYDGVMAQCPHFTYDFTDPHADQAAKLLAACQFDHHALEKVYDIMYYGNVKRWA